MTASNTPAHFIDLSKLKRKPVRLETITTPRFLFPNWTPVFLADDGEHHTCNEPDWNTAFAAGKAVVLRRNDRAYNLELVMDRHQGTWILKSNRLHSNLVVCADSSIVFEDLVRLTEKCLLLAHESYDTNVFLTMAENSFVHQKRVDFAMKLWRNPDHKEDLR